MLRTGRWAAAAGLIATMAVPLAASTASATTAGGGLAPLTTAQASRLAVGVDQRVIVVLRDQVASLPASARSVGDRAAIEGREQAPIAADLARTGARDVHRYTLLNAISATVSKGESARLAADPAVAEVVPDQVIHLASGLDPASSTANATGPSRTPIPGTCATSPKDPELAPQALSVIHADSSDPTAQTARSLGITGAGVKVAFIADGLDIDQPNFIRPDGSHVFVDYKDFSGEGTSAPTGGGEAFLDASSIAAQGRTSYDISDYSARPLDVPCYIRVEGVAPGASLVGLNIFGDENAGLNSTFLTAIDYAVSTDHVNVLNESLGNNYYPDDQPSMDLIKMADSAAVAAGTTVTVSSGDAGVTNTIATPASDPDVISAGASTTYEDPSQLGYAGFQFKGVTGYVDDNISSLSSSGFEQDGSTISLVAPGELNWALCSTHTAKYSECLNYQEQPTPFESSGGTSEAAPLTAGVAALVIQAYGKTHGGALPTPALVKQLITSTADDIDAPGDLQGSGRIDAYRAVLAAESYKAAAPAGTLPTVLEGTTQYNSVAAAGTAETFSEPLTNLGSSPVKVAVSSRTLGAYKPIYSTSVTLSDTASPTSVDYQGFTDNYEVVHFSVPKGVSRLDGSIAYQAASSALSARVRMNLVDPSGRLADYSLPQGIGNFGNAAVADPEPGRWTAYIWSRDTAGGGTTGPVLFGATVARYGAFGTTSARSVTIPAGATKTVTLSVATPSTPGDTAGSLVLAIPGEPSQTVPVTLRSLVPSGTTSFTGVLTGGNGRSAITGFTEYYQVDVPAGSPELNASVTLANDPDNQTYAWLIDPSGEAQAFQSNDLVTESSGGLSATPELGTALHVLAPAEGRWTLIVGFIPTVSGQALSEPFTVAVDQTAVPVTATGVPDGSTVSADHAVVARIVVHNTGTSPEAYFVDGRTDQAAQYSLAPLTSDDSVAPYTAGGSLPEYVVPSQTTALTGTSTTTGPTPIQFDMGAPSGDPDIASTVGSTVTASLTGSPITSGVWDVAPTVVGAFGPKGVADEAVTSSLVATTAAFDPSVTSGTGDLWQTALGAGLTVTPVVVMPGHSASIPVTFTPRQTSGSVVSGTLYLDDDSLVLFGGLAPNANTVAAIPYSYTVK